MMDHKSGATRILWEPQGGWWVIQKRLEEEMENHGTCSPQIAGSPTLKQHIQTIWYTYHQKMNDNTGYSSDFDFKFSGFRVLI